ncbi:hypothetical protein F4777DRAFT_574015 [Nemania sp. FL0916]|nr:hypothetical protein F4777DRAFT_574015 [Nemania sp. FL0916]
MDTINTMAASAAKAVWGENKQTEEPVSGRLGDTSKGEPYDAGNIEPTNANVGDEAATNGVAKSSKPNGAATGSDSSSEDPSVNTKAESEPNQTSKGQNDTETSENTEGESKPASKDANAALEEGEAPDVDGPGPKPLQDVAKEHGGDAGNSSSSVESEGKEEDKPEEAEAHKKESKGTGEKYEKTTGLQADGGDFDATRPGAGREADRLMEEKGIHNPTDSNSTGTSTGTGNNDSPASGKKSLGQKIKDKLHRH